MSIFLQWFYYFIIEIGYRTFLILTLIRSIRFFDRPHLITKIVSTFNSISKVLFISYLCQIFFSINIIYMTFEFFWFCSLYLLLEFVIFIKVMHILKLVLSYLACCLNLDSFLKFLYVITSIILLNNWRHRILCILSFRFYILIDIIVPTKNLLICIHLIRLKTYIFVRTKPFWWFLFWFVMVNLIFVYFKIFIFT